MLIMKGTQICPELELDLFSDHRTVDPMKLMPSTMLSAAYKETVQFSSLLCHCLPVFDEICEIAAELVDIMGFLLLLCYKYYNYC